MHATLVTAVLGRRARRVLAVTLAAAAAAGATGVLANDAKAYHPLGCGMRVCPDLVISDVAPSSTGFSSYVTVKNVGWGPAGQSQLLILSDWGHSSVHTVWRLNAGESHRVAVRALCPIGPGWGSWGLWADDGRHVAESNERNNSRGFSC